MISQRELFSFDIVHLAGVPAIVAPTGPAAEIGQFAQSLEQARSHGVSVMDGLVLTPAWFAAGCQRGQIAAVIAADHQARSLAQPCQTALQSINIDDWRSEWQMAWYATGFEASLVTVWPSLGGDLPVAAQDLLTPQIGTLDELADMVLALWSEVFCARNLCYWQSVGVALEHIPLAVVVQPLPVIEQSGHCWLSQAQLVIERFWGVQWFSQPQETAAAVTMCDRQTGQVKFDEQQQQPLIHAVLGHSPKALRRLEPVLVPANQWLIPHMLPQYPPHALGHNHDDRGAATLPSRLPPSPVEDAAFMTLADRLWDSFGRSLRVDWQYADGALIVQGIYPGEMAPIDPGATLAAATIDAPPPGDAELMATGIGIGPAAPVLGRAVVLHHDQVLMSELSSPNILVTAHLTPEWLPLLRQATALVVEQGGITSHAAVIARSLGIPAIIGAAGITQALQSGNWLQLHGGQIYRVTATYAMTHLDVVDVATSTEATDANRTAAAHRSPDQSTGDDVKLLSVITHPSQLSEGFTHDGIGLIRGEHLLAAQLGVCQPWQSLTPPACQRLSQQLTNQLASILTAPSPQPVWYRFADWRSHEIHSASPDIPQEANPALGQHGVWRYQQQPDWLDMELQAVAQLSSTHHQALRLVLPFVRTLAEIEFVQARLRQSALDDVPLWVMVEVPSLLYVLPDLAKLGVQGIVIGLNDLIQLLFGVDRDQAVFQDFFQLRHPTVQSMLHTTLSPLIATARQAGLDCHVCSVPLDREFIQFLVESGVTGLVLHPHELAQVRMTIAAMSH